jgi:FKBP-type peptidyl-prolyl cis-trans isomerase
MVMKQHTVIGIVSIVVLVVVVAGVSLLVNSTAQAPAAKTTSQSSSQKGSTMQLQVTDQTVGTGAEAVAGKSVTVNYTGTLTNGTVFDSSYSRNQPFTFTLGAGQVIKGWDEGVVGMKVGGKRKLVIPPSLGYGSQAQGPIPANSTLIFEVQLVSVN